MSVGSNVSSQNTSLEGELAKIYVNSPRIVHNVGSLRPKKANFKIKTPFFDLNRVYGCKDIDGNKAEGATVPPVAQPNLLSLYLQISAQRCFLSKVL